MILTIRGVGYRQNENKRGCEQVKPEQSDVVVAYVVYLKCAYKLMVFVLHALPNSKRRQSSFLYPRKSEAALRFNPLK